MFEEGNTDPMRKLHKEKTVIYLAIYYVFDPMFLLLLHQQQKRW